MNCPFCKQHLPENGTLFDVRSGLLARSGKIVKLSVVEAEIFNLLFKANGGLVRMSQFFSIWQNPEIDVYPNVRVAVCKMKKKLTPIGITIKPRDNARRINYQDVAGYRLEYDD